MSELQRLLDEIGELETAEEAYARGVSDQKRRWDWQDAILGWLFGNILCFFIAIAVAGIWHFIHSAAQPDYAPITTLAPSYHLECGPKNQTCLSVPNSDNWTCPLGMACSGTGKP